MTTTILVPVLGRPQRVAPLLASIRTATPEDHHVLFVASESDHDQIAAVKAERADLLVVSDEKGTYPCKINAGYRATCDEQVFLAADDLAFHPGWLTAARARLDGTVAVVGTNDLGSARVQAGRHATHNLVERSYVVERSGVVDQPDTVLHEGYPHAFCDDELVTTARWRGAWAFAADSVVEHLHPFFSKGDDDDTYRLGMAGNAEGRRLWARRVRLVKREVRRGR